MSSVCCFKYFEMVNRFMKQLGLNHFIKLVLIECCISKNNIYVRNVLSDMSALVYVHFFCQVSNLCKQYFKLFVAYIKSHQFTSVCSLHDYDSYCTINKYNTCGVLLWYFNGVFGLFRRWTEVALIWTIATWRYLKTVFNKNSNIIQILIYMMVSKWSQNCFNILNGLFL